MLSVSGLEAFYGESHILHGIDFEVGAGRRAAVLGRNGAGKSTFLKSIMNAGPRPKGKVVWNGVDLEGMPSHARARLGLCLVPEDRRIFSHLTVLENLEMARYAMPRGSKPLDAREVLAQFPMLVPLEKRLGDQLSGEIGRASCRERV